MVPCAIDDLLHHIINAILWFLHLWTQFSFYFHAQRPSQKKGYKARSQTGERSCRMRKGIGSIIDKTGPAFVRDTVVVPNI